MTSSCLLFGLASLGQKRNDTAGFLRQAFEETKRYDSAFDAFLKDGGSVGSGAVDAGGFIGKVSQNIWNTLKRAQTIAERASRFDKYIHARHLLAALLAGEGDRSSQALVRRLEAMGIQPRELREKFRSFIGLNVPDDLQPEWDAILTPWATSDPSAAARPESNRPVSQAAEPKAQSAAEDYTAGTAGYTSEFCGVGGSRPVIDHLDMQANARRLAELLALRETKLPLAVGLFGNWGAGKSHFMNLIDRHIKSLAESEKVQPPGTPPKWCREIVPIYFNAWHYLDTNLWASLVSQIFDGLFAHLRPKQDDLKKVQALLEEASGATARAAEEVSLARTATEQARSELAAAEKASVAQQTVFTGMLHGLTSLLPQVKPEELQRQIVELLGVEQQAKTLGDLRSLLQDSRSWGARVKALWNSAWKRPGGGWRLGWLISVLVLVPAITGIAAHYLPVLKDRLHGLGQILPSLLTTVSALVVWARPRWAQASRALKQLEDWEKDAEAEQERIRETPGIKNAQSNVKAAEGREQQAKLKLAQAEAREEQLQEEARNLAPERRLGRFIESRAQSGDYRGQLGLVSLARRDFQELSDLFADTEALKEKVAKLQESSPAKAQELQELSNSMDRIVLFVDDLDRCQPEKVVDVLQAVHLLLAFPLFAVIVGVDQRCLRQSLRLQFKGLLTADQASADGKPQTNGDNGIPDTRPATPLDYLEKIFHVPFHLPPMTPAGFVTLVKELTASPKPLPSEPPQGQNGTQVTTSNEGEPKTPLPGGGAVTEGQALEPGNTTPSAVDPSGASINPVADASGRLGVIGSVPLHDWERKGLESYYPLIDTPRGAKRLLNTYRLIRAGIVEEEWATFKGDGNLGEFRVAMLLLAAAAGYPAVAREWFELMRTAKDFPEFGSLWLDTADRAWEKFGKVYGQTFVSKTPGLTRELFCKWIDRVELFAF